MQTTYRLYEHNLTLLHILSYKWHMAYRLILKHLYDEHLKSIIELFIQT